MKTVFLENKSNITNITDPELLWTTSEYFFLIAF